MGNGNGSGDLAARLRARWARGAAFLGCPVPIVCGAMSWVSTHGLVAAVSEAGGFGVLAASAMPPEELVAEIAATRAATARPFGVNVVTLHPRFDEVVAVCVEARVEHVILAGGLPPAAAIRALKDAGAKVTCFAPVVPVAKRLIRAGVDALVVEGSEAGGHVGPTSTLVLAQEILPHAGEVPVFVAGGIATGAAVVACLELGAVGCQLGTRFAACAESPAHPDFKAALVRAQSRDAVISPRIDPRLKTIPVRALHNRAMDAFTAMQRELLDALDRGEVSAEAVQERAEHFWAGRLRRAVVNGDVEEGSLMAGQGVGLVKGGETAAGIVHSLAREVEEIVGESHGG
ncbi:MAG: nitronate monooxygenase [Hyphomicrobiales bacterium]|nr:nitronate monooxygenase [Hyphomicrobiales bacterium]MCP5372985.1 nitronate monooxygenase [Hyphomicrobiales bacterium]